MSGIKVVSTRVAPAPARSVGGAVPHPAGPSAASSDALSLSRPVDFKQASLQNRLLRDAVVKAKADPAAGGQLEEATTRHLDWLGTLSTQKVVGDDVVTYWLNQAADDYLAARPTKDPQGRYQQLATEAKAYPTPVNRALMGSAAKALVPPKTLPLGTSNDALQKQLAPAVAHLAASRSPAAQELARRIRSGEVQMQLTDGGRLGVQYWAMVEKSRIYLSNGQVGPNYFDLSPPFQAAVLLHEYTHVKQKERASGWVSGMAGNLVQRGLGLVSKASKGDSEHLDNLGMRENKSEQEAYRVEFDFLKEQGFDQAGITTTDAGMLDGVKTWLDAAK